MDAPELYDNESSHLENDTAAHNYSDFAQMPQVRRAFIAMYIIIIILTVFGNALVVYMVLCQKKMHNSVNYLICNLAVSDILVGAFVAPVKLLEMVAPAGLQLLNNPLCTALSFTQSVTIFSTILTLLVISLERYFAIVYPMTSRRFNKKSRTKVYIALTWLLAMLVGSPNLLGSTLQVAELTSGYGTAEVSICSDSYNSVHPEFRKTYFLFLFVLIYCIPMLIIIVTSVMICRTLIKTGNLINRDQDTAAQRQADNRRKVAAMMMIVSFGFAVCWSPYFLVTLFVEYVYNYFAHGHYFFSMLLINMLGFMNSCINPFIYIMNDRFREQYKMILHSCLCGMCIKMGWMHRLNEWNNQRSTLRTTFSQMSTSIRRMRAFSAADRGDSSHVSTNRHHHNHHHDRMPINRAFSIPEAIPEQVSHVLYSVNGDDKPSLEFAKNETFIDA